MTSAPLLAPSAEWRPEASGALVLLGSSDMQGEPARSSHRLTYTSIGRTAPHPSSSQVDEKTGTQAMVTGDPLAYARPVLVRDLELEWQILSRVAPAVSRELESQVDQYLATASK